MNALIQALEAESLPAPEVLNPSLAFIVVPNKSVPSLWWRMRKALRGHGWSPVIAGSASDRPRWMAERIDVPPHLPAPSAEEFSRFITRRRREFAEEFEDPEMMADLKVDRAGFEVPEASVRGEFHALRNPQNGEPWPDALLAFVRTDEAWKVPHVLQWGGFNEAPHPSELALTFWSWQERFGAIPAAVTDDTVELFLQKPLTDPALIAAAAEELAIIAPDVVWQGTESGTLLAAEMANRHIWFTWWD